MHAECHDILPTAEHFSLELGNMDLGCRVGTVLTFKGNALLDLVFWVNEGSETLQYRRRCTNNFWGAGW